MSLLYYVFMDKTGMSPEAKHGACALLLLGVLAQSGGFFVHMVIGKPNQTSSGNLITAVGAVLLTVAIAVLIYGLLAEQ